MVEVEGATACRSCLGNQAIGFLLMDIWVWYYLVRDRDEGWDTP